MFLGLDPLCRSRFPNQNRHNDNHLLNLNSEYQQQMQSETNLLIIGAGPFGLAIAAEASRLEIDHLIVGKPMEFWSKNMPPGLFLRSACDWHLDPSNVHTIDKFLETLGKTSKQVEPLSLSFYQSYATWFQQQKQIVPSPTYIVRLDYDAVDIQFTATTDHGNTITADHVAIAPGFKHFSNVPLELKDKLPAGRFSHTCDFVDLQRAKNKRFLIIGGRQSAYEWAALLAEAGASTVHISHRHESPAFTASDWSWVNPLMDGMVENPNWYRELPQNERDQLEKRFWAEGRLKLEPWLKPRLSNERVNIWPQTELQSCVELEKGELLVELTNGGRFFVDHVILATGYRVNIAQLPFLAAGNILTQLETRNGFPVLDHHFQTSIPGLFITSMPATQDFGPFFAFTIAVRASAKLICQAVKNETSVASS
jgi:cation diffusion facilitator CzcD-associated flavoprotein CzcO